MEYNIGKHLFRLYENNSLKAFLEKKYKLKIDIFFKLVELTDNDIFLLKLKNNKKIIFKYFLKKERYDNFIFFEQKLSNNSKFYALPTILNYGKYLGNNYIIYNYLEGTFFTYGNKELIFIFSKGLALFHKNNKKNLLFFIKHNVKTDLLLNNIFSKKDIREILKYFKIFQYEEIGKLFLLTINDVNKDINKFQNGLLHGLPDPGHIFINDIKKIIFYDMEGIGYGNIIFELCYFAYNFSYNKIRYDYYYYNLL